MQVSHGSRKSRRTLIAVAAISAGTLVLTACSTGSNGTSNATNIAAIIKGLDNPFFQSMQQGINEQSSAAGVSTTVQAANAVTDTTGQADKLTGLAGQSFSCFIVNPISGTNLVQGLAKVAAQKKPIVNIDSPIDANAAKAANAVPLTYIGTDNTQAGKLAGLRMTELVPNGGPVAVVGGISGDVTSGARVEGFSQGLGSKLKVAQTVAADWDRQTALTRATDILRANPNLVGFFVANDDMALGVSRAVANAGKTGQVKVISVDGIKDGLDAVKAGSLDATIAQYPYTIGALGVEACQAAVKGKTLPTKVDAPVAVVTKDNVDQALTSAPKPFNAFDDPFRALLQ